MEKLISTINIEENLHIDLNNLEESIKELEIDITIKRVKSFNNNYFPHFTSILSKTDNSEDYKALKEIFNKCSGLYDEWINAKSLFENKTLRKIAENNNRGLSLLDNDEINNIMDIFLDENQNIYQSIEFLSKEELIEKMCRKYNTTLVKENINILFA